MNKRSAAVFVVVLLVSTGVFLAASYREPEVQKIDVKNARLTLFPMAVVFDLVVEVYNPNFVGGTLESLDLDVYLNDQYVGPLVSTSPARIPGRGTGNISMEYTHTITLAAGITNTVRVTGQACVRIGIFRFTMDVEKTEIVSLL